MTGADPGQEEPALTIPSWTSDLSVYHIGMDDQHKRLFTLARMLFDCGAGDGRRTDALAREVVEYTYTHFASEEQFLARIGYPDLDGHKRHHAALFQAIDTITERYANVDQRLFATELATFVVGWLLRHIRDEDMKYGRFIADRHMRRATDLPQAAPADPVERLRRLKAAQDEGLLSPEEYVELRTQILAGF